MKKVFFLLLCVCIFSTASVYAEAGDMAISFGVSYPLLDLEAGFSYALTDDLSLRADIGASLFSLEGDFTLTWDLFLAWKLTQNPVVFGLYAGIPSAMMVFTDPTSFMVSFGGGAYCQYPFSDSFSLGARLGAGYPLFIISGEIEDKTTNFPLGIWPDLCLEAIWNL